jgi:hypothetical protein
VSKNIIPSTSSNDLNVDYEEAIKVEDIKEEESVEDPISIAIFGKAIEKNSHELMYKTNSVKKWLKPIS